MILGYEVLEITGIEAEDISSFEIFIGAKTKGLKVGFDIIICERSRRKYRILTDDHPLVSSLLGLNGVFFGSLSKIRVFHPKRICYSLSEIIQFKKRKSCQECPLDLISPSFKHITRQRPPHLQDNQRSSFFKHQSRRRNVDTRQLKNKNWRRGNHRNTEIRDLLNKLTPENHNGVTNKLLQLVDHEEIEEFAKLVFTHATKPNISDCKVELLGRLCVDFHHHLFISLRIDSSKKNSFKFMILQLCQQNFLSSLEDYEGSIKKEETSHHLHRYRDEILSFLLINNNTGRRILIRLKTSCMKVFQKRYVYIEKMCFFMKKTGKKYLETIRKISREAQIIDLEMTRKKHGSNNSIMRKEGKCEDEEKERSKMKILERVEIMKKEYTTFLSFFLFLSSNERKGLPNRYKYLARDVLLRSKNNWMEEEEEQQQQQTFEEEIPKYNDDHTNSQFSFPEDQKVDYLYLDGNNMMYITETLRNQKPWTPEGAGKVSLLLIRSAEMYKELVSPQAEVTLVFDGSFRKQQQPQIKMSSDTITIITARPKYNTADDCLMELLEMHRIGDGSNMLFVTSDIELKERLRLVKEKIWIVGPLTWLKKLVKKVGGASEGDTDRFFRNML